MPEHVVRDVPLLNTSTQVSTPPLTYDAANEYRFRYRAKSHRSLPHVVKFSGGRSSGMLLFILLENRLLDSDRGDVIVFNNTSAEHPNTYRYVHECMLAARRYGVPFFQIEFQTYEDASRGEWIRLPTYRLVNDWPYSATNPDGFHWRGEVFEELLSWSTYVPNQFHRICTRHLKLEVTRNFLKDWLSSSATIPRLGHFGSGSRVDPEVTFRRHKDNRGEVPKEILFRKRSYLWQRPHFRPEQRFEDFSLGWKPFENAELKGKTLGNKAWFGKGGVEYVAFIGLRGDEAHRVRRVESRNEGTTGYEGEHVYMPLKDMEITRKDVNLFWDRQDWDLSFREDPGLSNCVYCFLKGVANLQAIHAHMKEGKDTNAEGFGPLSGTPSDLTWWSRMEAEYGRDLKAEGRTIRGTGTRIGFFGSNRFSYEELDSGRAPGHLTETLLPCDCTE